AATSPAASFRLDGRRCRRAYFLLTVAGTDAPRAPPVPTVDREKQAMSLTVQSIMQMAVMNGASVLAGRAGLQRNVKAATVLDAPDAINWLRGEELVLTSTYPFRH